jgi:RNA polymerase sigma factor for flagellar operon FliA
MKATPVIPSADVRSADTAPEGDPVQSTLCPLERNKLIEQYLPFVNAVLAKLRRNLPTYINSDDLYSAGVMGLIAAADRFDRTQMATFPGYVRLRIRCAILDELRRLDSCTRRSRARTKEIQLAVRDIEQEVGRAPTDSELSAKLNITVAELRRWRANASPVKFLSLDGDPDGDGTSDNSLHEVIMDQGHVCVRESMERQELLDLLSERLSALPEMQQKILALYYFEGARFAEIAEAFNLSEARISQIHKQAVAKLQSSIFAFRHGGTKS